MLGRHLKTELELLGHDVVAPNSSELDLRDARATSELMERTAPDAVVHSAAKVGGIQANIEAGGMFLTENLAIDHSVIFGAKALGIKNFVYIGSSCMYPANRMEPLQVSDIPKSCQHSQIC